MMRGSVFLQITEKNIFHIIIKRSEIMIYLDNAATSFKKPDCVIRATYEAMCKKSANPGRSGHNLSVLAGEILYDTRKSLAKLFNIENPERITFCQNTTEALNKGIKGIMSQGGHIITTSMEHNSVIRPIKALEGKNVICSILNGNEQGELNLEKLEKMIKRETKLIVMTASSNVCGNIYDIKKAAEIAHQHNVLLMVDGAQSVGMQKIDASDVDLLAFPGHKGLMGPMGTGGLYVKEGIKIKPIIEGGTGSVSESLTQPDFFPDILESGTMNVPGIAGLGAATEFILKVGIDGIFEHESFLRKHFEEMIRNIDDVIVYGGKNRSGICAFNILGMDCVEVAQRLNDEYGICVRSGLHCAYLAHKTLKTEEIGCIRASFGYFNTLKDAEALADAVYKISKNR